MSRYFSVVAQGDTVGDGRGAADVEADMLCIHSHTQLVERRGSQLSRLSLTAEGCIGLADVTESPSDGV